MKKILLFGVIISLILNSCNIKKEISPEEAKDIAKEAYLFAYPMLYAYQLMYTQAINEGGKGYTAPINNFNHFTMRLNATHTFVVGPNNNTLYSLAWLDLNNEPLVLDVPIVEDDRFYVFQIADIFTHNFAYIGSRTTGQDGGKYLLAGPNWQGSKPDGIKEVFQSEGQFLLIAGRIYIESDDEVPVVTAIQDKIDLQPLSKYLDKDAPIAAMEMDYHPSYNVNDTPSVKFFETFNFLLSQLEPHESEKDLYERFSKIGIEAGGKFDTKSLRPEILSAVNEGITEAHKEISEHSPKIGRKINGWNNFGNSFGNRNQMQGRYLDRAAGAMSGIYGNSPEENSTFSAVFDEDGDVLDGSKHNYQLTLMPDQIPPVKGFWSITVYDMKNILFVPNSINRFSVWGGDKSLKYKDDGSLNLFFAKDSVGMSDGSNWFPAPDGKFAVVLRVYWPDQSILEGTWDPTAIKKINK